MRRLFIVAVLAIALGSFTTSCKSYCMGKGVNHADIENVDNDLREI